MSLLHEIQKQPQAVREFMFFLSVVTTLSVVGLVWFNSFQHDLYVLLNPEPSPSRALAQQTEESQSPLAIISRAFQSVRDGLGALLGRNPEMNMANPPPQTGPAQVFPLSEPR